MIQEISWIFLDHATHVPSTLSLQILVPQPVTPAMVAPSHSQLGPKITGTVVGSYFIFLIFTIQNGFDM